MREKRNVDHDSNVTTIFCSSGFGNLPETRIRRLAALSTPVFSEMQMIGIVLSK